MKEVRPLDPIPHRNGGCMASVQAFIEGRLQPFTLEFTCGGHH